MVISRRDTLGRGALVVLAMWVSQAVHCGGTWAAERARPQHTWGNAAAVRPQLEAPRMPTPDQIPVPSTSTVSLLLSANQLSVPKRLRLMIFAPHPDDETLAAGGLIQRVLSRGGTVRVVFVTNGDGYVDGVEHEVKGAPASTSDFIHYGQRRHDEGVGAVRRLGLHIRDAVFLGFPDGGIDELWTGHWSSQRPYTSPYTRSDHPPYRESLSRTVGYAGADLEAEITGVLRRFRPNWVVLPDPRDRHPDHSTTGVFVLDALRTLRRAGDAQAARVKVFTFLVHYPDYPASPAWTKEIADDGVGGSATAGTALAAARWVTLPLTEAERSAKRTALSAYQSQAQVMDPFLEQFLGASELFGQLDATQITAVPAVYAARAPHGRRALRTLNSRER
jgi:LmbE family N-acetylglucosaminyl deacetylase